MSDMEMAVRAKIDSFPNLESVSELDKVYREAQRLLSSGHIDSNIRANLVSSLHRALLQARTRLAQASTTRQRLVEGSRLSKPLQMRENSSNADPSTSLGREISENLIAMGRRLAEEIERAEQSAEIFEKSTRKMAMVDEVHRSPLQKLISATGRHVGGLLRREQQGRNLIIAALTLYVFVVIYVLNSRFSVIAFAIRMPFKLAIFLTSSASSLVRAVFSRT